MSKAKATPVEDRPVATDLGGDTPLRLTWDEYQAFRKVLDEDGDEAAAGRLLKEYAAREKAETAKD